MKMERVVRGMGGKGLFGCPSSGECTIVFMRGAHSYCVVCARKITRVVIHKLQHCEYYDMQFVLRISSKFSMWFRSSTGANWGVENLEFGKQRLQVASSSLKFSTFLL